MYILSIDTSCDETSVAITKNNLILSNIVASQYKYHKKYGGVVPSLAKIAHKKTIDKTISLALKKANVEIKEIDLISVTIGPGLAIALEVGINKAKEISKKYNIPIIPINHMEGHLLSSFVYPKNKEYIEDLYREIKLPALGVLVSGGHTELILVNSIGNYKIIGETLDDACGECFDKCARMLNLGYPGGKIISKISKENKKNVQITITKNSQSEYVQLYNNNTQKKYSLPVPKSFSEDFNMSFSGLKTAFNNLIKSIQQIDQKTLSDLCILVESTAIESVTVKIEKYIKQNNSIKEIWLGGGVIANTSFVQKVRTICKKYQIKLRKPYSNKLTGDNAAMIAIVGYFYSKYFPEKIIQPNESDTIDRIPNLRIDNTNLIF